jgi:site-specific DNA recombinase
LEQRIEALATQERQLSSDADRQRELAGIAASLEEFRQRVSKSLANATFEQRRELVLLLIDRVVVTGAEVEIRYVLPTSLESEHVRFCQLRKDYFHRPASHKELHDLQWILVLVGAQQSLGIEAALRVTDEYPADRNDRHTRVLPYRTPEDEFDIEPAPMNLNQAA